MGARLRLAARPGACIGLSRDILRISLLRPLWPRAARSASLFARILLGALTLAAPARALAGDTLGVADTLPPPGTFLAAYVADSVTGLPLTGASVTMQNPGAYISIAITDERGWAYIPRSGLPFGSASTIRSFWVSAGNTGYLSRLKNLSSCGDSIPTPCTLRYALGRATEKNSLTFTGTLLDPDRKPLPLMTLDLSSQIAEGWITFLATTDEKGSFVFKDVPKGLGGGFLFVRRSPSTFEMLATQWSQSGDTIVVPRWSTTSLAAPGVRPRAAARGK